MTWIKITKPDADPLVAEALADARAGYPAEYGDTSNDQSRLPADVRAESIVLAHSLIPKAMRHMMGGYATMLDPALPLSRRHHELIAATVSAINRCYY